jgi:hypothetical protein
MSEFRYPDEFIKKAEARIQKQVSDNGVDPKTIKLTVKRQGQEILCAQSWFDVDVDVKQTSSKGKNTIGQVIEQGHSKDKIDAFMKDMTDAKSFLKLAQNKIKSLPLKGFGADNATIILKDNKTTFTEHVACNTCQGQGQTKCQTCFGVG